MDYRVEQKYLVTDADLIVLAGRLKSIMTKDVHQVGSSYEIRSLYFDDMSNHCMYENESGVDNREKYRIRVYNYASSIIHLEIKEKVNGMTKKAACVLTREEADKIMEGKPLPLIFDDRKPLNILKLRSNCDWLMPKVIIAYERSAFVYNAGNVRITFDRNITASSSCSEFFKERFSGAIPVLPTGVHVLEVKYDEFLPNQIAAVLEIGNLRQTAFSKYYLGRLAVQGKFPVDA